MNDDLARVRAIFDEVIDAPPDQRPALLARRCGDDAALRRRVEALISSAESDDPFLSQPTRSRSASPAAELPPLAERPGTRIGPYKLLQQIGEGGFGVVFMAEQDRPVRRRVALKVIKLGMDTRQVVARFEQEREALAMMEHPNIARVLDAGATDSGRPYFVMEYVKGDNIIAFADAHRLSLRDRLDLFTQVCAAVQHAHTKGVIHRDLKPSNVLASVVDGRPFVKVIDFGIAKATGARLTDKTLFTEHRQLIGTPEYMSPEQAEGSADIDTRTDVYSLGVLLYELLTGVTPFDGQRLRSAAWGEMQRIIKEEEPPAPSVRLSRGLEKLAATAAARAVEPARLSGLVHGELDWIVMKALDKDRARRYESPNQFAADVQRHLAGEAVVAAPASAAYRLRKFVRRNKGPVLAAAAVTAALVVGAVGTTLGIARAINEGRQKRVVAAAVADGLGRIMDESAGKPTGGMVWSRDPGPERINQALTVIVDAGIDGIRQSKERAAELEAANAQLAQRVETAERQRQMIQSALESLYRPGEVISDPTTATAYGSLEGIRARDDYQQVPDEDRSLWEVAELAKYMTRRYVAQTDLAESSAYTANLALAQSAMDGGNWPEARERLAACPKGKRGWEWRFLDLRARETLWQQQGVSHAVLSPDGSRVACWTNLSASNTDVVVGLADGSAVPVTLRGHTDRLACVSWSPDGRRVVTGSWDGSARVWNADGSGEPLVLPLGESSLGDFAEFSPDGTRVLTVSRTRGKQSKATVRLWNADGSGRPRVLCESDSAQSARWSPDGERIATWSGGGPVCVWSADGSGSRVVLPASEPADVWGLEWSPDGTRLAAYDDKVLLVISADGSGEPRIMRIAPRGNAGAAGWSPDGKRFAIGCEDGAALVWPVDGTVEPTVLRGHYGSVRSLAWSPDSTRIVTASDDGARMWDAVTGVMLGEVIRESSDNIFCVSFSPDGSRLLVCEPEMVSETEMGARLIPADAWGGPDQETARVYWWADGWKVPESMYIAAIAAFGGGTPLEGLDFTTPDGSRRITAVGATVRFARVRDGKEPEPIAVFRLPESVTNLKMTGDGTRLIIQLAGGWSRVWDIREPGERARDAAAKWAEREPAARYLDSLLAGPTPTDRLIDAVVGDPSLPPLRRLVAAELLRFHLDDLERSADRALATLTKGQTEKSAVLAAARTLGPSADLPPRAREMLMALAEKWEYRAPSASAEERLAEEVRGREIAEARAALGFLDAGADPDRLRADAEAVRKSARTLRKHMTTFDNELCDQLVAAYQTVGVGNHRYLWAETYMRGGNLAAALNWALDNIADQQKDGRPESPIDHAVLAMIRFRLSTADAEWFAAAARVDERLLGAPYTRQEHLAAAHRALSRARAIMADPEARDESGHRWSETPDAAALLREAEGLIEPAPASAPERP